MRIALFAQCMYSPWIEWIKNNSLLLSQELSQKIDVEIISHKPNELLEDANLRGLKIHYLLRLSENKIIQFFYFIAWGLRSLFFIYWRGIKLICVQYIEISFIMPMFFLTLCKRDTSFIVTIYSTDELEHRYKLLTLKLLRFKIKKIVIISEYLRGALIDLWFKDADIEYIPLSYDKKRYLNFAKFKNRDKKLILFSAWPIKEAWSFFMVDLAKIMPDYNFIFAMRKFNKKSEDELGLLNEYIKKNWVKNIEIRRNIEKMEVLLGEVWCLVLPLQDINVKMLIPVALLEAMARWTICFVSDLPNLELLVEDKVNAIVFKKNDLFALKKKIDKFVIDETISESAHKFWNLYPDYKNIWEKYFSLFEKIEWST